MLQLASELSGGAYKHDNYWAVVLYEKKRRDLAVASVRDRIVHRLLYDYLISVYDKSFDFDVWSSRRGKGMHACLSRTQQLLKRYSNSYVWRSDITKFYDNVEHATLLSCINQKINYDQAAIGLINEIINSYSKSRINQSIKGIPIGNLTSQIFSNIYLNEFDRFVRHSLKPQAYVRYGDDFIIFFPNRRQLCYARILAINFLQNNLSLAINIKNDVIIASKQGLKFLGHLISKNYIVVDGHTTKMVMDRLDWGNVASYRALYLNKETKACLEWVLLEKPFDI